MPRACPEAPAHASAGVTTARVRPGCCLGVEAWTPPGFSGRPFWASPSEPPCSAPSAPQQQDGPAWFGREAARVQCATALSWAARLQNPVLCSLPCSRPASPGHPDRSLLARLDAVPPAPRGRAQPSLPTPALHSFPAAAPAGQLPGGELWPWRGRLSAAASAVRAVNGPGAGSRVRGSPGPPRQEARLLRTM